MKQTRQPVHAVMQSIFLDVYGGCTAVEILLQHPKVTGLSSALAVLQWEGEK
jgi:hypothetical protein